MKNILIAIAAAAALAMGPASHAGTIELVPAALTATNSTTGTFASPSAFDISSVDAAAVWATATNSGATAAELVYRFARSPDGSAWGTDYLQVTQTVAATSQAIGRLAVPAADLVGIEEIKLHSFVNGGTTGWARVTGVLLAH